MNMLDRIQKKANKIIKWLKHLFVIWGDAERAWTAYPVEQTPQEDLFNTVLSLPTVELIFFIATGMVLCLYLGLKKLFISVSVIVIGACIRTFSVFQSRSVVSSLEVGRRLKGKCRWDSWPELTKWAYFWLTKLTYSPSYTFVLNNKSSGKRREEESS